VSQNLTFKDQCIDERLSFRIILEYIESTAVVFKKENKPYFQFTWLGRLAHDEFYLLTLADKPLKSTLQFFNDNGHLNNTALFILGDHGTRFGTIIRTEQGKLEDRLPALYIVLPPWFKVKYPIAWKNLHSNQDKLVSSFDMHRTLLQMKNLEELSVFETNPNPTIADTEIQSPTLFHKISHYRSCFSAGIPMQYCPCQNTVPLNLTDQDVLVASKFVVRSINSFINIKNTSPCATLKVQDIVQASKSIILESASDSGSLLLNMVFTTVPGEAMFESTVYRKSYNDDWILTESPARINRYQGQSDCVTERHLKPYCYCSNLL
jgi:hypothetical protein